LFDHQTYIRERSLYEWTLKFYNCVKSFLEAGWTDRNSILVWKAIHTALVHAHGEQGPINCSPSQLLKWSQSFSAEETVQWIHITNSPQVAKKLSRAGVTPTGYLAARKSGITQSQILKTPNLAKVAAVMAA
jgi:hypothetical protein